MSFEIFHNKQDEQSPYAVECWEMFVLLNCGNYAVSTVPATVIRSLAKKWGLRVSVTAHPRDTTYIVKLKDSVGVKK